MALQTSFLPVKLNDESVIHVTAIVLGGEMDVAATNQIFSFQAVADSVESIADSLVGALQKVKPTKATIEFGLEFAIEAGKLTALLVNGNTSGSLTVTLEWESKAPTPKPRLKRRIT